MIVSDNEGEILSIRTLGGLTVIRSGVADPIRFETRFVEALLVYLAFQGRAMSRDLLAELLWPWHNSEQARTNLRVTLYRLRREIAPYLLITRQSIAIHPNAIIDLDVKQFEALLGSGQLALAISLYRGDFLEGFYVDGSPSFEQWALLERERLRNLAVAALHQLIDHSATAGQHDTAIAYAQQLLRLDSLHEPTHRQLMRLLTTLGQRSAALTQYEICRTLLDSELGVSPDETTRELYERILTNSLESTDRFGSISASLPAIVVPAYQQADDRLQSTIELKPTYNLAIQPTTFIGRRAELEQIERLLSNPDCRLLTLVGVGGVGKTYLALEAARIIFAAGQVATSPAQAQIHSSKFVDGISFVSLASVGTTELALVTIAQSLGLQIATSDLHTELVAYLRPRQLLLILDNLEHLPDAADSIGSLLQNAPRLKCLVTSRERLYLREEWLLPIMGLSLTEGMRSEAAQLFLQSVQRLSPDFSSRDQEEAIAALCRQVEGMPLALELAASWARVMPCCEIVRHVQENIDFLNTGLRNLPERHRSMRALFDQSWRLLSPLEQGVLMRLSVFAGGWAIEEAAPVTGATLSLLLTLVDKSLLRSNGQNRFDMHELVRQYAAEKLVAGGEANLVRQRHYAAYLKLSVSGDSRLRGPETAKWLARLEPEQDNLRAALQWSLDVGRYDDMAWLMLALLWSWHQRGYWYEYGRWLSRLMPHRHTLDPDQHLAILLTLYAVTRSVAEFLPVGPWIDEAMPMLEHCTYKLLHSAVWHFAAAYSTDFSQSAFAWERSIELARASSEGPQLGPEFGIAADRDFVLGTSIQAYAARMIEHGDLARAATLSQESFKHFQARGSLYETADSLTNLGYLALLQGDLERASVLLNEAVTLSTTFNYQEGLANSQPLLGIVILYCGDPAEARRLLTESLRVCSDLKDMDMVAHNCTYLAQVALVEGEVEQAAQWLAQSLVNDAEGRRINIQEVERLFVAARVAASQEQNSRAATLFGLADEANSRINYAYAGEIRSSADRALTKVRSALGAEAFDNAFAAGRQLSLQEAFRTILTPLSATKIG